MSSHDRDHRNATTDAGRASAPNLAAEHDPAISRRASVSQLRAIQMKLGGGATENAHDAAAQGVASPTTSLPHASAIQESFGPAHDVSSIQAHVGGNSASAMGASAYATGNHVVFDRAPDLHTAAHEAAHVVQQAQGVNLYGGVGEAGDHYERHADAVADRVVAGQSAADLLGASPTGSASTAIQRKDITDGTKQEHAQAHEDADRTSADAFASKVDLLAVRMRTSAQDIDRLRMTPPSDDAGIYRNLDGIRDRYHRIRDDAEDLYRASALEKSLSGAQHSVMNTDFAILLDAFNQFDAACHRAINWGRKDGLDDVDPDPVRRWVEATLGNFDVQPSELTPRRQSERIDDKSVEDLENQTLVDSIAAMHADTKALRMNAKSSTEAELGGDLYKLMEAVHATKEILTSIDLARIGKMSSLKAALDELAQLDSEMQTSQPNLAKRLSNSVYAFDVRTLHSIVASHKPKKR